MHHYIFCNYSTYFSRNEVISAHTSSLCIIKNKCPPLLNDTNFAPGIYSAVYFEPGNVATSSASIIRVGTVMDIVNLKGYI
jgi:hypothetical protein